jgi:hypothetical protein
MTLRWNCEKNGCYKDSRLPDWGFLKGCFPRGIEPTDIDGMVHLGGDGLDRFLFLEEKGRFGGLHHGQTRAFHALSRMPGTQVLCFRGHGEAISEMLWYPDPQSWRSADRELVKQYCMDWAAGVPFVHPDFRAAMLP